MKLPTPIENPFHINPHRPVFAARADHASPTATEQNGGRNVRTNQYGSLLDTSRTMAGMLLAAVLAAVLVVADQLIEIWAEGHLLVVWITLWVMTFAVLSLVTPPLRQLSAALARTLQRWSARRTEEDMWDLSRRDYRLMDEWSAAHQRDSE
jgi:hypothetical protein